MLALSLRSIVGLEVLRRTIIIISFATYLITEVPEKMSDPNMHVDRRMPLIPLFEPGFVI